MLNKNSIYVRLLFSILCLLFIQTLLIGSVLLFSGAVSSLKENAIGLLQKNAENRSITLENMMVRYWSNIDRFEGDAIEIITEYCSNEGLDTIIALKDYDHTNKILDLLAVDALSSLRTTQATGIFIYFVDEALQDKSFCAQGLYFRDLNPLSTPKTGINQKGGTGLGLAISSGIICTMNSKIELISKENEGSEFFFTLCLLRAVEPIIERSSCDMTIDFASKRALLAEDNEINIEIAQFILEELGFEVTIAKNGSEAVNCFLASPPNYFDVIFMDIQMPIMDGLRATRAIRKNTLHPSARTIPIIAMTANAFNEDMRLSIEAGMNGHISKPIDTAKLYKYISGHYYCSGAFRSDDTKVGDILAYVGSTASANYTPTEVTINSVKHSIRFTQTRHLMAVP